MKLNRRSLLTQLGVGIAASPFLSPLRASQQNKSTSPASDSGKSQPVRLDHNENAYGPSKKSLQAIQESAGELSRYPDVSILQNALAAHHTRLRSAGVSSLHPEQLILGCGSTDILRMVACAFLTPHNVLIQATPTCGILASFARERGALVTEVPLRKDHAHDLDAMLERARQKGATGLIYVCNPNSPTSTLTARKDLESFLAKVPDTFHLILDEAYHEYAGGSGSYASFAQRPAENPRVIVTRTFSSAYGLAGARVGYAVCSTAVGQKFAQQKLPFALNSPGVLAATAALSDPQHIENCVKRNFDDRQEFMNQVNARMLRALDSHTNFVCLNVMRPAAEIFEHYRKNNFVLAPLIPSMPTYLRISLGTPGEMIEFWRVWDLLGSHPMSM